ncbi:MAG: hypothetical protein H6819_07695 [Phycisphaerales bacterium]|nr:hypothetical protein [Phycisphaerales bacterium]MCB9854342.1 hypothetical protein [Phycisphaerales bacterium]MCB9863543.1 hypothetical protein [Phycisphaerales bacterium]
MISFLLLTFAGTWWTRYREFWLHGPGPDKSQWQCALIDGGIWIFWDQYIGSDAAFDELVQFHHYSPEWTSRDWGWEVRFHHSRPDPSVGFHTPTWPKRQSWSAPSPYDKIDHGSDDQPCLQGSVVLKWSYFIIPLWTIQAPLAALIIMLILRRMKRRDPSRCAGCGYRLRGNVSGQCPECGLALPQDINVALECDAVQSSPGAE